MLPDYRPFYFVNNPEAFRLFKSALSAITDIKNKIVNCLTTDDIEQTTGSDTAAVMSQAAITSELNKKLNIAQGVENEGKIPQVNASGNLELANAPSPAAMHNYSTTEQVIGTWIDGKPLYEKSIILEGSYANSGDKQLTTADFVTSDYDFIYAYDAWWIRTDNETGCGASFYTGTTFFATMLNSGAKIFLAVGHNCTKIIITFRYTKSTDTAPVSEEVE